jgi:pimeloyl-ACP methyl ester carboxylesterase
MALVPIDDITVNVETTGSGLPLVLLHGSFMNTRAWRPQLDGLSRHFHVIAPDLRGHGGTPCPVTPRSFDRPRDVIAVLDQLGVTRAIIGGHSMGGPVALQIALDYPERCLGLVLLATGLGPEDRPLKATPESKAEAEARAARLLKLGPVEFFHQSYLADTSGIREFLADEAYRRDFEAILSANNPAYLADWLRLAGIDAPSELQGLLTSRRRPRLPEIQIPVLFMVGSLDETFLPVVDILQEELPHSLIEVIPNATHMLTIDASERVNRRIADFAGECVATGQG